MVVCKYFQQGTCRYGQYCRFQHINSFGGNQGNGNKQFSDTSKTIAIGVAEEVLAAERGGQWLLSCFGPIKEQPCIPGMEDVSPEEVRWEMYQAQKNGTVDQTKLQFQQLCQAMTAKREALKNPTLETIAMLEKLQKSNRDSTTFGGKANFALSTPQMSQPSTTATSSSIFAAKPGFGSPSNPFGGGFNASTTATPSIFGRASTTGTSVFGAKPSFGGTSMFGSQPTANTVFGGAATKTTSTVFGGNQNMQSFASATSPPPNSVFGGVNFGTTQASSPFSMSQPAAQSSSVFGTTTTAAAAAAAAPTNSIFGGPSTTTLFGAAAPPATNIFGAAASSAQQAPNPFGAQPATAASSTIASTSIFGPPKNTAAFGGAPVFGATGGFGGNPQSASVFGAQASFDNALIPNNSVFGGTTAQSSTFGSNAQNTNNFGALAAAPQAASTPFGAVASAANATPFGTSGGPFGSPAANSPFARAAPFTGAVQPGNEESSPFAAAAAAATGFGNLATAASQPFGAPPAFGTAPTTPFASTTSTTTTSNPFAPRSQQQVNTPFGIAQTTMASAGAFGQSSFGSANSVAVIDEAFYTIEGQLTDDEKSSYMADKFAFGKIPLESPTIELR